MGVRRYNASRGLISREITGLSINICKIKLLFSKSFFKYYVFFIRQIYENSVIFQRKTRTKTSIRYVKEKERDMERQKQENREGGRDKRERGERDRESKILVKSRKPKIKRKQRLISRNYCIQNNHPFILDHHAYGIHGPERDKQRIQRERQATHIE